MPALTLELARSAQSSCKVCRAKIGKGDPRVGVERIDERFGATMFWHHAACFNWQSHSVHAEKDFAGVPGFSALDAASQKRVVAALESSLAAPAPAAAQSPAAQSPAAGAKRKDPMLSPAAGPTKKAKMSSPGGAAQLEEQIPLPVGIQKLSFLLTLLSELTVALTVENFWWKFSKACSPFFVY